jgi:1-acylglycerone phosphate reductase
MTETALITGCSKGGIGDALAQEFYHKGVRVIATARDLSKIHHLKTMGLDTLQLDVTSEESIQNAVRYIEKETGGKLDYLVNNAGMGISPSINAPTTTD